MSGSIRYWTNNGLAGNLWRRSRSYKLWEDCRPNSLTLAPLLNWSGPSWLRSPTITIPTTWCAIFNLVIGTHVLASTSIPASSCMMMIPLGLLPPTCDRSTFEPAVLSVQITQGAFETTSLQQLSHSNLNLFFSSVSVGVVPKLWCSRDQFRLVSSTTSSDSDLS